MSTVVYAQQGDTVDLICRRHYGRTARVTEHVLDANRGLAAQGDILRIGTRVVLPLAPSPAPQNNLINLWD